MWAASQGITPYLAIVGKGLHFKKPLTCIFTNLYSIGSPLKIGMLGQQGFSIRPPSTSEASPVCDVSTQNAFPSTPCYLHSRSFISNCMKMGLFHYITYILLGGNDLTFS